MGVMGPGNFDNDTALDFYLFFVQRLTKDVSLAINMSKQLYAGSYWSDIIPCIVEILTVLSKKEFHIGSLPDVKEIKRWKRLYMEMWENTIGEWEPDEEYRKEREKILNKTFDDLIKLARKGK